MAFKWLRKFKQNKVAEALAADAHTREQLLSVMRKSIDTTVFHTELIRKPGVRMSAAKPTTVSYDYYKSVQRLGASPRLLRNLKPIVRDWPDDENPGNF